MLEIGAFPGVLDRERADIPFGIDVELGVLVEILRFDDSTGELDLRAVNRSREGHAPAVPCS
jgi:hypothetical protein